MNGRLRYDLHLRRFFALLLARLQASTPYFHPPPLPPLCRVLRPSLIIFVFFVTVTARFRRVGWTRRVAGAKVETFAKDAAPVDLTEPLELLADTKKLVEGVLDMISGGGAAQ